MTITKKDIVHVADLARLEVGESDIETFVEQLGEVLEYVNTLNRVDTEGVPPTSHAISLTNAFREDTACAHLDREEALRNAPEIEDGSFLVPKIMG